MGASGRRQLVILADSLVVGGAERVLQALAEDLPGEGFCVRVACLRASGPVGEELRSVGVPVDALHADALELGRNISVASDLRGRIGRGVLDLIE